MYLDGMLIEAKDLVNGVSVVQAEKVDNIEYFRKGSAAVLETNPSRAHRAKIPNPDSPIPSAHIPSDHRC